MRMYEEHIRFMILAEHELCELTTAAADQEAFNSHLNLEQINKAWLQLPFPHKQYPLCCYSAGLVLHVMQSPTPPILHRQAQLVVHHKSGAPHVLFRLDLGQQCVTLVCGLLQYPHDV